MKLLKRNTENPARELRALKPRLRDAKNELAGYEAALEGALAEREALFARDADAYLGVVDPAQHEQERDRAEERVRLATEARDRQARIVDELKSRCTRLDQARGARRVEKFAKEDEDAGREVEGLEQALDAARRRKADTEEKLAVVRAEENWAGSEFSDELAAAARAEEKRSEDPVRWHVANPHADARIPVELRARVAARRADLAAEVEDYKRRLAEEAAESWRKSGVQGEPPKADEPFARLAPH
jgi:hypothetical protein